MVEEGPALELDAVDSRVPVLRRRLTMGGDLADGPEGSAERYDERLEAAVITFQARHGLEADGIVGPRTLEELNVPVEHRVDQLRASLERARWVFRDLVDDLLVVDIAGFKLHLVRDGVEIWSTPVQVGLPYHSTPIFKSQMTYLVLNPTWTVPPGILRRETLPKVREDQGYLVKENMSVIDASGRRIDPATLDWDARFPYSIRQEPGPNNALGRVKFMFPNPYMVYLHDTPSKSLFGKASRAFSHGCIRVQDPLRLAELLLEGSPEWDRAAIERTLATSKTTTVLLPEALTVMLLYWTAEVREDGTVAFKKDIYNRDPAVIRGLDDSTGFSSHSWIAILASPIACSRRLASFSRQRSSRCRIRCGTATGSAARSGSLLDDGAQNVGHRVAVEGHRCPVSISKSTRRRPRCLPVGRPLDREPVRGSCSRRCRAGRRLRSLPGSRWATSKGPGRGLGGERLGVASALARPKSSTLTRPSSVTLTLAGLRSR